MKNAWKIIVYATWQLLSHIVGRTCLKRLGQETKIFFGSSQAFCKRHPRQSLLTFNSVVRSKVLYYYVHDVSCLVFWNDPRQSAVF